MQNEVWRDVQNYEGLYKVSNLGRILSVKKQLILKPKQSHHNYLRIQLYNKSKFKTFAIHRIVATAFIPNPNNYKEVNHLNENPSDNSVANLEWCSRKHNVNYGARTTKTMKMVTQIDKNDNVVATYRSLSEASKKTNARQGAISNVCTGRAKTAGGSRWRFTI